MKLLTVLFLGTFHRHARPAACTPLPHAGCLLPCAAPQGKRLLRLWFARPIVNLAVLEDRLDGVQFFLERHDAVQNLRWVGGNHMGAACEAGG